MAISKANLKAFRAVMSHFGKLAAGVPKTMSPAALAQRQAAGRASALARGLAQSKKASPRTIPRRKKATKRGIKNQRLAQSKK